MSDALQLYQELAADALPLEQLLESLKQTKLYHFALQRVSSASPPDSLSQGPNPTDLMIYLSDDSKSSSDMNEINHAAGDIWLLQAIYNQRLFSSSRISFILAQISQIITNASLNPEESIGKIDIMTEAQRKLLPDPQDDLHW